MNAYIANQEQVMPKASGQLTSFQQAKVMEYLKLVKWVVNRIRERLPKHIDAEDLSHSGILGLIDAVQRFSWGREKEGEEFKAYAECRIRGQIMDELRSQDLLSRSEREKVNIFKKGQEELKKQLTREPTEQELCAYLKVDIETCHYLRAQSSGGRQISLDEYQNQLEAMEGILKKTLNMINPHTPEGVLHMKEVKRILAEEIDRLSDRERQVVSLYYLEEMTLKEIGSVLDITESRVSQIHAQSLNRLMGRLKLVFTSEDIHVEENP